MRAQESESSVIIIIFTIIPIPKASWSVLLARLL